MINSKLAEEGTQRRMTLGEIAMARQIFGDSITYNRVWIHCDSYLPFGLQKQNYSMTPNGELWYRKPMYKEYFSSSAVFIEDKYVLSMSLDISGSIKTGSGSDCEALLAGLLTIPINLIK